MNEKFRDEITYLLQVIKFPTFFEKKFEIIVNVSILEIEVLAKIILELRPSTNIELF